MTMDTARQADDRRRWQALWVCLTAGFMTLLDSSIVNVALPSMERGLGADTPALSWVVAGYALTLGLALVPAGRLGDLRGRRTVFLYGLALFTLASAACGLANDAGWLVFFRLSQGVASGILAPQTTGLIQQMFRGTERARAFGMLGSVVGLSTAIGPPAGGLLIHLVGTDDGWRWVFYVPLPFRAVALFMVIAKMPALTHRAPGKIDFLGSALMLVGFLALSFSSNVQTFSMQRLTELAGSGIDTTTQMLIFAGLFLGFAIKVPMFPFHTWLPDVHVEAPPGGSAVPGCYTPLTLPAICSG